jgi:TRAP-type uncharacterized transport system substrate-binding protein
MTDKLNDELGSPFVNMTMPANSLDGQEEPVSCLADFTIMIGHANFPDEMAYEITKSMADIGTDTAKYIGAGKLYRRETICSTPPGIEPHPGSVRACKDMGLME